MKNWVLILEREGLNDDGWPFMPVPFGPYTMAEATDIRDAGKIRMHADERLRLAHLRTLGA